MRIFLLHLVLVTLASVGPGVWAAPQEAVKGKWFTEPDAALTTAEKVKKPVLAVAMDHG